jgi:hypothetical protein
MFWILVNGLKHSYDNFNEAFKYAKKDKLNIYRGNTLVFSFN